MPQPRAQIAPHTDQTIQNRMFPSPVRSPAIISNVYRAPPELDHIPAHLDAALAVDMQEEQRGASRLLALLDLEPARKPPSERKAPGHWLEVSIDYLSR